jgi:CRP-like cAMP-binding protein
VIAVLLNRIEENALFSQRQRLAQLIVSAAQTYGVERPDPSGAAQCVIAVPLSQQNMGKLLGVTRHSVQRELGGSRYGCA